MGDVTRVEGGKRVCIVGAGPSGLASAHSLASSGHLVHIYEKRNHLAGNCYDEYNDHNILIHKYGPHYFRTNSLKLLEWLSQFTEWIPGRYFVRCKVGEKLIPMPISLATMTALKGEVYTKEKFESYLASQKMSLDGSQNTPQNAEDQCLSLVGRELYESIFKGYTTKQWGIHPRDLDPSITARIPLRFDWDERYPQEQFQVTPKEGFTALFKKMSLHKNISIFFNTPLEAKELALLRAQYDLMIFTGPIDLFFDYRFGKLSYRSLNFAWEYKPEFLIQSCVQINYPNDFDYTRTVEIKHVTGQICKGSTLCYEYPTSVGDPFYPLLTKENKERFSKYQELADLENKNERPVYFLGRLAEYKYYNMDHVLLNSLKLAEKILEKWKRRD